MKEDKRKYSIKFFAMIMNHMPTGYGWLIITTFASAIMEMSFVLDGDLLVLWSGVTSSESAIEANKNKMIAVDVISIFKAINPYPLFQSMTVTMVLVVNFMMLILYGLLTLLLLRPQIIFPKEFFEPKKKSNHSVIVKFIFGLLANYEFIFYLNFWMLIQSIPCVELSKEQQNIVESKANDFLNSFEEAAVEIKVATHSSCLNKYFYCYEMSHITLITVNLLILPMNLYLRSFMNRILKFAPDPNYLMCRKTNSDLIHNFMIISILLLKLIIYLGNFSNSVKKDWQIIYSLIAVGSSLLYQSKQSVYYHKYLTIWSLRRNLFLFSLCFGLSQLDATPLSFISSNYTVFFSSLLFYSISNKIVLVSMSREAFQLNLKSDNSLLQSLFYILQNAKQRRNCKTISSKELQSLQYLEYTYYSSKLNEYLNTNSFGNIGANTPSSALPKPIDHLNEGQEQHQSSKLKSSNYKESNKINATLNSDASNKPRKSEIDDEYNLDHSHPMILELKELNKQPSTANRNVLSTKNFFRLKNTKPSDKQTGLEFMSKYDGFTDLKKLNQLDGFLKDTRPSQFEDSETTLNPISLKDLQLVDQIIRKKLLSLSSVDTKSWGTIFTKYMSLYLRLNLYHVCRPAAMWCLLSELTERMSSYSSDTGKRFIKSTEFAVLIEMVKIRTTELLDLSLIPTNNPDSVTPHKKISNQIQFFETFKFVNTYQSLKQELKQVLDIKLAFMTELFEDGADFDHIFKYSSRFTILKSSIDKKFSILQDLAGHNFTPVSILHGNYLYHIIQDTIAGQKIIQQTLHRKYYADFNMILNMREAKNKDLALVQVSLEKKSFNTISYSTENLQKHLAFSPEELLDKPLEILLPTLYQEHHRSLSHPLTMRGNLLNQPIRSPKLFKHRNDHLVKCEVSLQLNPQIDGGVEIAAVLGFSKTASQSFWCMIDVEGMVREV